LPNRKTKVPIGLTFFYLKLSLFKKALAFAITA
jgi:hypothetical protein